MKTTTDPSSMATTTVRETEATMKSDLTTSRRASSLRTAIGSETTWATTTIDRWAVAASGDITSTLVKMVLTSGRERPSTITVVQEIWAMIGRNKDSTIGVVAVTTTTIAIMTTDTRISGTARTSMTRTIVAT